MVEGALDYDLEAWASEAKAKMQSYCRMDAPHAVCMAIREDVWDEIGYFMPVPKLLGYEDGIFFQRAKENHLKTATVGDAWLHHYGMTTQKALKLEKMMQERDSLGNRSLMKMYMGLGWWQRKMGKSDRARLLRVACARELAQYGFTVHSVHAENGVEWK
jgi:hypothetical protein